MRNYRNSAGPLLLATAAAVFLALLPGTAGAQNTGKNATKADAKAKAPAAAPLTAIGGAYPQRPLAPPEVINRGKVLFEAECGFCHGEDARGDDMGSNLIRSRIVLNDDKGEQIAPVLRGQGVEGSMMPKFNFTETQIADVAAFLHSFRRERIRRLAFASRNDCGGRRAGR